MEGDLYFAISTQNQNEKIVIENSTYQILEPEKD